MESKPDDETDEIETAHDATEESMIPSSSSQADASNEHAA